VADNQGDWLPSSKIVHVRDGAWFGSRSVDPEGTKDKKEDLPVVWLPQDEIGNSPSTPLAIDLGPYKGQMIHGEVTHGGIKRVFVEEVNGQLQGCVFRFIQGLEAGVNRIAWGPGGDLYVGGIGNPGNWGQTGKLKHGLQRLAFNNKSTFEMLAVRAKSNGMEIEFTEPVMETDAWNINNYEVKQWYYKPTIEYGGPKLDERKMAIKSVSVSDDRKKVFLEVDGLKDNHMVYIHLKKHFISDEGSTIWSTEAWYTMNQVPKGQSGTIKKAPFVYADNTLTEAERKAGWSLLFDGKSMGSWRNFKKKTLGKGWVINENAIHLDAKPNKDGHWQAVDGGDIITDKSYENYEFTVSWKINNCGNSGIIFNVVESDKYDYVWQTGPEMQVLDNTCHPDSKFVTHRAGDLYDMIECKYSTVKPAGEWNEARIKSLNGKVDFWLNGYKVVSFTMHNDQWKKMVAGSKFKDMPDFGLAKGGHISLQDHGDKVWFKNIKIRALK
jgi:cytochrome c